MGHSLQPLQAGNSSHFSAQLLECSAHHVAHLSSLGWGGALGGCGDGGGGGNDGGDDGGEGGGGFGHSPQPEQGGNSSHFFAQPLGFPLHHVAHCGGGGGDAGGDGGGSDGGDGRGGNGGFDGGGDGAVSASVRSTYTSWWWTMPSHSAVESCSFFLPASMSSALASKSGSFSTCTWKRTMCVSSQSGAGEGGGGVGCSDKPIVEISCTSDTGTLDPCWASL